MSLHSAYTTATVQQLQQSALMRLPDGRQQDLDHLLDLTMIKILTRIVDPPARPMAVSILRADPARLASWLDQDYPTSRMTIIEGLTRVLLSLTVE